MARIGFWAATAALVVLGCLRPALPLFLRDRWPSVLCALAVVAALSALVRCRRGEGVLWALFPLTLAALYLQPQRVASDGIFYFTPLHSIVVDHDLDFENEYRVLGAREGYFSPTITGRLPNNFSIGPAILWTPFYLAAHAMAVAGLYRPTGFGYPYFTAVATGTALFGFLGVVWLYRLLRSYYPSRRLSCLSALLVWLGSFHVWYMVFEPSMSHAMAMASVALYLLVTHEGAASPREFATMGALGGLVALIRWQNVLFLPVALATSWSRRGRPRLAELAVGAAAFIAVFSPQLAYWKALYGSALLVPQGGGYVDLSQPALVEVLFSSRHGLLSWSPVLWLGVLGFPSFARRAPAFAWGLLAAALGAWYVNASVYDWWAGASYGSRRFDAALPGLALGMAAGLAWVAPKVRANPRAALALGLAPFILWNVLLMGVYSSGAIPADGPASFRQAASDGIELLHSRIGYPPSWPASLFHSVPLPVYDLEGSGARAHNVYIRMGDVDALYLGRGWTLPSRGRDRTTRTLSGPTASLFVALNEPAPYTLSLLGVPGTRAGLALNGTELGEIELGPDGRAQLTVAPQAIRAGMNELVFGREDGPPIVLSEIRWTRPGSF